MSDTRYRDAEWLEEQYHDNELSTYDIADKCGVCETTVSNWMKKHGIERRGPGGMSSDTRYKDAEWLEEQYHEHELSQSEIADKCDVGKKTVSNWMEKYDIEARGQAEINRRIGLGIRSENGYRVWHEGNVNKDVRVHRLLGVAEYGFDAVCDMHVHHQNGIKWDNRPDNIELLTPSEHAAHHMSERHEIDDTRYRDEEWLEEQYHEHELSQSEIADKCDVGQETVSNWMEKYDIESREPGHNLRSDKPADQQMEQAQIAAYQD